jgi:hypothetical protein
MEVTKLDKALGKPEWEISEGLEIMLNQFDMIEKPEFCLIGRESLVVDGVL